MIEKVKWSFLRLYFSFYASRFFARTLMPIRIKFEKFLPNNISFSQFCVDQYFINFEKNITMYKRRVNFIILEIFKKYF